MAMKKAKKGDEPVRVGRAKEQKVKGFIEDPTGWTDSKVFRQTRSARGLGYQKDALMRVPKDAQGKKISKQATADAKKLVEYGKKKYGTKFVVSISPDAGAYISKAGATLKGQKAQSARMTKQANSPAKSPAQSKTDAARFKPIRQPNGEINEGQLWKANRTYKNTTVPKAIVQMLRDDSAVPYKTRSGKRMITGTYKGAGSKQNKKGK